MWKHVTCLSIFESLNLAPHCLLLFPLPFFPFQHSLTVYLPFPLSLHIWPFLFLFPPLLFLFGRFNAFTPPLHSCGCFIHQSQHYSTNPTASSFAPLHLPLHQTPRNTWSVPGGLYTPRYSAPLLPFSESLGVSLILTFWWSSLRPYSTENSHIPWILVKL